MLGFVQSSLAKLTTRILQVVVIFCLACTATMAQDSASENSETRPRRVADATAQPATQPQTQQTSRQASALSDPAEPAPLQVAYALYDRSITFAPEPPVETPLTVNFASRPVAVEAPRTISLSLKPLPSEITAPGGRPAPQKSSTVASTAPMTAGEKFGAWGRRFITIGPYAGSIFNGMWKELEDNDDFKEDTVGNYFADAMTRAARGFAFASTAGFLEKALLASLFKQDPRYHRMPGKNSPGRRLLYAATRVFVTQGDRCGCHQFNASFLLGSAGVTAIANLWERSERTGPWHNVRRFYTHIGLVSLGNVVREFISGQ